MSLIPPSQQDYCPAPPLLQLSTHSIYKHPDAIFPQLPFRHPLFLPTSTRWGFPSTFTGQLLQSGPSSSFNLSDPQPVSNQDPCSLTWFCKLLTTTHVQGSEQETFSTQHHSCSYHFGHSLANLGVN
ncbi:unnamed protein product [Hymenolepis diminuta]|uniref:Uncharacterized protein n=1 Tax=Hymenolepis diminuta TaxID=6216 RepID=A0A564YY05_HYMDI|nr:unnamed protein product [Hymenolepis diminuta]VUZ52167.1 unnamed protein product [Hymenolepis diminuta]